MKITYSIIDKLDHCFVNFDNVSYKYSDLLKLLYEKKKEYIKLRESSDLIEMEKVIDDFDKSNLTKDELESFKYWRKQSKAKSWFSSQRIKRRKGKLKQYQIEMLNRIGMVWNPKEDEWEKNFVIYRSNLVYDTIIKMQKVHYGLSDTLLNNLKKQELWLKKQRDYFKIDKIEKENLNRLNSINFPFTLSADELSKPSIYSLIISAYTIKTLNEELKNSRKIFVNFYKLPQENKKTDTLIEITDFIVKKNRGDREKLELEWDIKTRDKFDKEIMSSEKIAQANGIEFLNSKSTEYFFEQIDRYGKRSPLTWNEKQNFKEAEINYESDISFHSDLYYEAYNRLNAFLSNSYFYQRKIKGITYSTFVKYQFSDEVKCYTSEKMLDILNEKLLVTGKFNNKKSFKPISFLLNYYKSSYFTKELQRLGEIIKKHQILSILYSERIEKALRDISEI